MFFSRTHVLGNEPPMTNNLYILYWEQTSCGLGETTKSCARRAKIAGAILTEFDM